MSRHSKDESMTVLENESSRHVFEKASSMSAKLTQSSSDLNRKNEFLKFPFDSVLLESKVYRRVCESSWIREVSTTLKDGNESSSSGPASMMSVSSSSAIASEEIGASLPGDVGVKNRQHGVIEAENLPVGYGGKCDGGDGLTISSPGLAELHHLDTDPSVPQSHGGTEMCEASAFKHDSPENRVPSIIEIIVVMSTALKLACWLASGEDQLKALNLSRYARKPNTSTHGSGTPNNEFQARAEHSTGCQPRPNMLRSR